MTVSLAGWRRAALENGLMLQPPEQGTGLIQIRHQLPLRPLGALTRDLLATPLGGNLPRVLDAPRAITTDEGEHAAILTFAATGAREVRRTIGVVFGDDWMSMVDGRCAVPDQFADYLLLVERLTMSLALGLGADRYRRYRYTPPTGWSGLQRFRCDVWLAAGMPLEHGVISVFHARPEAETRPGKQHHKLFEELTVEFGAQVGEPRPMQTRTGLVGQAMTYHTATDRHAGTVVFGDGRNLYMARLETDTAHRDANTEAFLRLVDSIEPVPWPRRELAGLVHWSD